MLRSLLIAGLSVAAITSVQAQEQHPIGLWVVEGSACDAEQLNGFELTETEAVIHQPGIETLRSEIADVTNSDAGYVISMAGPDQQIIDITLALDDANVAQVTPPGGEPVKMTPCAG